MSPFRYRDEESPAASALYVALGALAGFAAGVVVAQQYGGISGITAKIRDRLGSARNGLEDDDDQLGAQAHDHEYDDDEDHDEGYGEGMPLDATEELEERVLEAFRNDPVLSERAIDIGALDEGIVELTGWVNAEDESQSAVVVARGVPGVETVVNRLAVRAEEDLFDEFAEKYEEDGGEIAAGQWEGQSIGTGRRRQGNSAELDRHEDPKPGLEEAELEKVYLNADEEADIKAERRKKAKPPRGGRADGSPVGPSGVPKSDHVADPLNAPNETAQGE
ncbi:MAG: BON domain-containing protein [Gemmatimonadaceae bacterium]